jgi:hypothetical protein
MLSKQPTSAQDIFSHAERFYRAFLALRALQPDPRVDEHAHLTLIEPLIVLGALSTELFLKCLICIERPRNSPPRDHNLKRLFDELGEATRKHIEALWDSDVVPRRRDKWDEWERFGLKIPRDLSSALEKGGKAFNVYRYSYEENTEGVHYYLDDLSALLETLILEMKPDLKWLRRAPLPLQQYH